MATVTQAIRVVKDPTLPRDDDEVDLLSLFESIDDEPAFEPSLEHLEWIAATNLDSFVGPNLVFPAWLDDQARQHALRGQGDPAEYSYAAWHAWLGSQIARLASDARHFHAGDPSTFDDREAATLDRSGARSCIDEIADLCAWLKANTPYDSIARRIEMDLFFLDRLAR